uniref:Uncharacterized protein n=1 Tax=Anguilla anguilla TaxID=7936 RepID=A0A0E9QKH4_ANGAN
MITAVYLFTFITVNNDGSSFLILFYRDCLFEPVATMFLYFQTIFSVIKPEL